MAKKNYISAADRRVLPILASKDDECYVVDYVLERMRLASAERNRRFERMQLIDQHLAGYMKPQGDDVKRNKDNNLGKAPKPIDHNLPLAQAQIDEAVTYLMTVFAPESDIFEAVASADKQEMAQGLTAEMNKQGQKGQYYRHMARFINNSLKYNFGAMTCGWEKYEGIVFKGSPAGLAKKEQGMLWQGNKLTCVNMYNFFWDTSVNSPVDLPIEGEFFAEVELVTPFRVRKRAQDKQLFGINRFVTEVFNQSAQSPGSVSTTSTTSFYQDPPSVRSDAGTGQRGKDFREIWRGGPVRESSPGIEIINFTGWLNPKDLGLGSSNQLELWKLKIANGKYLTFAAKMEDTHGQLPIVVACPNEDDLGAEQKSVAEQLIPLQHYASFLLNTDQAATRKSIFGITVYNPALVAGGLDLSQDDLIGARIPIRSSSADFNIDQAFRHYNESADTSHLFEKFSGVMDIMQRILPTDFLKQVADLERATLYQAAATVQAGNRRHLKTARIIADQAMTPLKFQMIYNLYANMPGIDYIDPMTGNRTQITTASLIEASIELDIGNGLKGIDRLMQIQIFRDVLNAVIQSQQAIQEIDIVLLLNYFTSLAGDRTDLTQFRRKTPPPVQPGASTAPPVGGHAAGAA